MNIIFFISVILVAIGIYIYESSSKKKEGDWERITRQMNARREFDRANLYKKFTMDK